MKRLLVWIAALSLLAGCALPAATSSSEAPGRFVPGEYSGSAKGYQETVEVTLTLSDDYIEEIRVKASDETRGIGSVVTEQLPSLIVQNQTLAVDVVAGATATSNALLAATEEAIASSGADTALLLERPEAAIAPAIRADVIEADVVIIGAGGAGLTAAIAAKQQNPTLRVALLEKTASTGGSTLLATHGMNGAGTAAQQKAEIADGFDALLEESLRVGKTNDEALLEILAGDSAVALDWLTEQGAPLPQLTTLPGSKVARAHLPEESVPIGSYLVEQLTAVAEQEGIALHYNTRALALTEQEDVMTGVIAEAPGVRRLFAAPAVVLATGGFGANDKLCGSYRSLLRGLDVVSPSAAQGDGIAMAQELGAMTVEMAQIATDPTVHRGGGQSVPPVLREAKAMLLSREGARFVDEQADDLTVSNALLSQSGRSGWMVFPQHLLPLLPEGLQQSALVGETPEALALLTPIPPAAFKEALEDHIAELSEQPREDSITEDAPSEPAALWHGALAALEVSPGIKTTLGGLLITPQGEVVGADGEAIVGLFAAGEVTGGIHGEQALPGNQLTELIVFGRRAGQSAALLASIEPALEAEAESSASS